MIFETNLSFCLFRAFDDRHDLRVIVCVICVIYDLIREHHTVEKIIFNQVLTVTENRHGVCTFKINRIATVQWQGLYGSYKIYKMEVFALNSYAVNDVRYATPKIKKDLFC